MIGLDEGEANSVRLPLPKGERVGVRGAEAHRERVARVEAQRVLYALRRNPGSGYGSELVTPSPQPSPLWGEGADRASSSVIDLQKESSGSTKTRIASYVGFFNAFAIVVTAALVSS